MEARGATQAMAVCERESARAREREREREREVDRGDTDSACRKDAFYRVAYVYLGGVGWTVEARGATKAMAVKVSRITYVASSVSVLRGSGLGVQVRVRLH